MLLYIMLYIMLAYLMLFASLFNVVCLYKAFFLPLTFVNAFCFHALSLVTYTVCLFEILPLVMHSALNLLVFLILCSHCLSLVKGLCVFWRNST